jgi:hypothetical protein
MEYERLRNLLSSRSAPTLNCPKCGKDLTEPVWRLRIFLDPRGAPCTCPERIRLRLAGNHWLGLIIGACLMAIGGRLHQIASSTLLSLLFLIAGIAACGWGFFTSSLMIVNKDSNDE